MSEEQCGLDSKPGEANGSDGQVVSMEGRKRRGRPRLDQGEASEKPRKIPKTELANLYVDAINYGKAQPTVLTAPPFGRTFHTLEDEKGRRWIVEEIEQQVLRAMDSSALENEILAYSRKTPPSHELEPTMAAAVLKTWVAMRQPIPMEKIAPVRPLTESGYCWSRLPWDLEDGPTPVFDEMLGRMTNHDAFMAFIGATCIQEASRQQYLWISGTGNNGKSSIGRFLDKVFGIGYASAVPPDRNNSRFFSSYVLNKRIVAMLDCNTTDFVTTSLFKMLTGEDAVPVEGKGVNMYSAKHSALFIFFSNFKPEISGSAADKRRLIYCEIAPVPESTELLAQEKYQELLLCEGSAFLWKCISKWRELTKEGTRPIPSGEAAKEIVEDLVASNEETFELFFKQHLNVASPETKVIQAIHLREIFQDKQHWSNQKINEFYHWLERYCGAKKERGPRSEEPRLRWVSGITWDDDFYKSNQLWVDSRTPFKEQTTV